MKRILLVSLLLACSGLFAAARAQSPVAPEKAQHIRRLLEISGSHNLAQQMID
jgi:hypothetical protein